MWIGPIIGKVARCAVFFLVVMTIASEVVADGVIRSPLDEQWEEYMLAGSNIALVNGVRLREDGTPYTIYEGKVDHVWGSDKGIRIDDMREVSLGGLLTGGGWRLEGGLLSRIEIKDGLLELCGKSRWQVDPQLFHFGKSPPRSARHSYDFFLLLRPKEAEQAKLIKKWHIPSEQLPYDYYPRGLLKSKTQDNVIAISISGVDDNRIFVNEDFKADHQKINKIP